ncbi:MAG: DUF5615 family PIN-like protein [Dehalococcoidia bacterium]|nr:DUF5615 family PIN-like protein [Dehalococcoidia bacterium]
MLFKLDENLPRALAGLFAEAGHDAVTVAEQEMAGADDSLIAAVCRSEGRALVTLDMDFADIRNYPPQDYPGLVVFRLSRHGPGRVLAVATRLIEMLPETSLQGQLWIVEDERIRIRE